MISFKKFLAEQERIIGKMFGLNGGEKRGGNRLTSNQRMARLPFGVVNPAKPTGMIVPGEIFGKRKSPDILGS